MSQFGPEKSRVKDSKGAAMPDKDMTWWAPAIALALGVIGGLVRLLQGWHGRRLTPADYRNGAIDLFGSAFITIIVYLLVKWGLTVWLGRNEIHEIAAVGFGGLAGHIGVRATVLSIEQYIKRKLK